MIKLNLPFALEIYLLLLLLLTHVRLINSCRTTEEDHQQPGCRITLPRGGETSDCPALLLREGSAGGLPEFFHPDTFASVQLRSGEAKLRLQCPYPNFIVTGSSVIDHRRSRSVLLACDRGALKLVDASSTNNYQWSSCGQTQQQQQAITIHSLQDVRCSRYPMPVSRLLDRREPCPGQLCLEIGFQLSPNEFLAVVDYVALDVERLQPLVAKARIPASINSRQPGRATFPLRAGPVFRNIQAHVVFQRDYQRKRFRELLGDDRYVSGAELVEGQLVSDLDLYYRVERSGAFFLENIVPIWDSVASGNWELSGEIVRGMAATTPGGIHLWSGAIDVLALPDSRGQLRKLYLAEYQLMPVPKLLYKYAYDPHSRSGLILVTINDPYLPHGLTSDLLLCPELSFCRTRFPQLTRRQRGYTYCCSPQGFLNVARALKLPTFSDAACFQF